MRIGEAASLSSLSARMIWYYEQRGVCGLPQTPGGDLGPCVEELERCVTEHGFIGCLINPDPTGVTWEVPVQNLRNLDCTHYPQPQTGVPYTASAGEC